MNLERLERLKERYRYPEWGRDADGPLWDGILIEDLVLPGWNLDHVDTFEHAGRPRLMQSVWRGEAADRDQVLSVDIYIARFPEKARELLLEILDEYQGPQVARVEGPDAPGNVAFAHPGGSALLFVVGNVVVHIRNAGRELVSVGSVADAIEEHLRRRGSPA